MAQGDRETSGVIGCGTPAVTIPVSRHAINPALEQIVEASSGDVDPTYTAVMTAAPVLTFTTRAMSVLGSFGIAGAEIVDMVAWLQQLVKYGTRNATSKKLTIATGLCVPRTLTVTQGQPAELTLEAVTLSTDGATAPVVHGTGAMTANPTPVLHTLGPVKINGTQYDVERMTIDFGIQVHVEANSGDVYPTYASIMSRMPSITLTGKDVDLRTAVGLSGLAQSATDSLFYLRKLASGGTRVANNVAEHIKFTIDDGLFEVQSIDAAHGERSMSQILLRPISDAVAAIIEIDTASAIT